MWRPSSRSWNQWFGPAPSGEPFRSSYPGSENWIRWPNQNILFKKMDNQMSLDELIVFTKVVEAKSFTAAGEKLGLPKSTVSQKVARLEKRLGVQLLARSTRQVRPTNPGASYYERCVRAIAEIEEAELS